MQALRLLLVALAFFALPARAEAPSWTWSCAVNTAGWSSVNFGLPPFSSAQQACSAISGTFTNNACSPAVTNIGNGVVSAGQCSVYRINSVTCNGNEVPAGSGFASGMCTAQPLCPSGKTYRDGICADGGGGCSKNGPYVSGFIESDSVSPPLKVQNNGCVYEMADARNCQKNGKKGFCYTGAPTGESVSGQIYGLGDGGEDPVDTKTGNSTAANRIGQSGGGQGGEGTGYNSGDAANLKKVADNTATTIDAIDKLRASREAADVTSQARLDAAADGIRDAINSSKTAITDAVNNGTATTAGKLDAIKGALDKAQQPSAACGGENQPPCSSNAKIDETGSSTVGDFFKGLIEGKGADALKAQDDATDALGTLPNYRRANEPNLLIPYSMGVQPACKFTTQVSMFSKTFPIGIDICPYSHYLIEFLSWAVYALTLVGLFLIVWERD